MKSEKIDQSHKQVDQMAERDAAYNRIYERYGSDLPAFFRDVYKDLAHRREKLERCAIDKSDPAPTP